MTRDQTREFETGVKILGWIALVTSLLWYNTEQNGWLCAGVAVGVVFGWFAALEAIRLDKEHRIERVAYKNRVLEDRVAVLEQRLTELESQAIKESELLGAKLRDLRLLGP